MSSQIISSPLESSPPSIDYEVITLPKVGEPEREELFRQCYGLRIEVFSDEQGFPAETELDDYEEIGTHFLLRLLPSKEPIGTIRVVPLNDFYKVTRLVVLKKYRKFKLGRVLMQALHEWVVKDALAKGKSSGSTVECRAHSQLYVQGFYAKYGYEPQGPEHDEDGEPHQCMVLQLPVPEVQAVGHAPAQLSWRRDSNGVRE